MYPAVTKSDTYCFIQVSARVSAHAYLFIWVLELTIRKELEGADGEASGLTLGR